jgi:type IV pilus assembly protein PilW
MNHLMNQLVSPSLRCAGGRQRGVTLIELMIAVTVAFFLIGGLLLMVQSTRNTFATQNQLAQLQDNERLVMSFMAEVIESAGYFPSPNNNLNTTVMPVAGVFASAGQAVFGTYSAAAPGDTVTIRYGAGLNDNIFNCRGTINTTVANYDTFVDTFWVNNAVVTNPVLTCTFSSNSIAAVNVPLVNGVKSLAILYGIKRSAIDTGSCADTYLNAGQMLVTDWSNVCSIQLKASFINPLDPTGAVIPVTRVIAVMNWAGVNS